MSVFHAFAPAKINLYLHITGKRDDGYHRLDSLVAFTNIGDALRLEPAPSFSFVVEGPMAGALAGQPTEGNLVVRAARGLAVALGLPPDPLPPVRLTLVKNLPVASGIGGGSSDAAAALRLLAAHWGVGADDPRLHNVAASLGQDVPCCIDATTCYLCDVGATTEPGPLLPHTDIVLVNPNKALPTPAVYKARTGGFVPPARLEHAPRDARELADMLAARGNGLTDAACHILPDVRDVLTQIAATPDCLLARMSGSGATCFGLYPDRAAARKAASDLLAARPDWWVVPAFVPTAEATTKA